jgi:molybdenum cofactor cytidylyltransferase
VVKAARARGILAGAEVVIRAGDEHSLRLTEASGFHPVVNHAPPLGLSHSLRIGIESLEERRPIEVGAALIFLADQPLVQLGVVEKLVAEWRSGSGKLVRPRYHDEADVPGHPVLLDRSVWPLMQHLSGDRGLAGLLDIISQPIVILDVPGDNPDVDTPADLQALEEFPQ